MELKQRQTILYEYELGQVASEAERLLVWYVHSRMHELQDGLQTFFHVKAA